MTVTGNTARHRRTEALASSTAARLHALERRSLRLDLRLRELELEVALTTWQRLTRAARRLLGRPTP